MILCGIVFAYLIITQDVHVALEFSVVLMVASIPMAIEIVTNTTLAVGITTHTLLALIICASK